MKFCIFSSSEKQLPLKANLYSYNLCRELFFSLPHFFLYLSVLWKWETEKCLSILMIRVNYPAPTGLLSRQGALYNRRRYCLPASSLWLPQHLETFYWISAASAPQPFLNEAFHSTIKPLVCWYLSPADSSAGVWVPAGPHWLPFSILPVTAVRTSIHSTSRKT